MCGAIPMCVSIFSWSCAMGPVSRTAGGSRCVGGVRSDPDVCKYLFMVPRDGAREPDGRRIPCRKDVWAVYRRLCLYLYNTYTSLLIASRGEAGA